MPDSARSRLAELREVEERVAARTARIDQLQAAVASSPSRRLRFGRTLLMVACASALVAVDLRLVQPLDWTFNATLATVAAILTAVTFLFTGAIHRFMRSRETRSLVPWVLAAWLRWSPLWQLPASPASPFLRRNQRWRLAIWLFVAAALPVIAYLLLGSVALAGVALALVGTLLHAIWSRRVSAPDVIEISASAVALIAALSIGISSGALLSQALGGAGFASRPEPGQPHLNMKALPSSELVSRPAGAEYANTCPRQVLLSHGNSLTAVRLDEAWLRAGVSAAGCPSLIQEVNPGQGVVAMIGRRRGRLTSVAVADANRSTLMIGQAAAITFRLIEDRNLRGVPIHLQVGSGDIFLLDTAEGTYVLARRTQSIGPNDNVHGSHGHYVTLPPALAGLWIEAMSQSNRWLWPTHSRDASALGSFVFTGEGPGPNAHASCPPPSGPCELSIGRSHYSVQGSGHGVSVTAVLRYAPGF